MSVPKTFLDAAPAPGLLPDRPVPRELQQRLLLDGIGPPAHLWVDANDILQLQVRNLTAGVQLQVAGRLMEPDGRIITPAFTLTPASDGSISTATQALYEGYLLSTTVTAIGATLPNRGNTYCVLKMLRMPAPSSLTEYLMGADYVSSTYGIYWPGGRLQSSLEGPGFLVSGALANPAAGADWALAVSGNQRWRIRGGTATLVTSAAVATRQVAIIVDDGTNTIFTIEAGSTQVAGLTQVYNFLAGTSLTTLIATQQPVFIPTDLMLMAGWRLRSSTGSIQAADQWSAIRFLFERYVED